MIETLVGAVISGVASAAADHAISEKERQDEMNNTTNNPNTLPTMEEIDRAFEQMTEEQKRAIAAKMLAMAPTATRSGQRVLTPEEKAKGYVIRHDGVLCHGVRKPRQGVGLDPGGAFHSTAGIAGKASGTAVRTVSTVAAIGAGLVFGLLGGAAREVKREAQPALDAVQSKMNELAQEELVAGPPVVE